MAIGSLHVTEHVQWSVEQEGEQKGSRSMVLDGLQFVSDRLLRAIFFLPLLIW